MTNGLVRAVLLNGMAAFPVQTQAVVPATGEPQQEKVLFSDVLSGVQAQPAEMSVTHTEPAQEAGAVPAPEVSVETGTMGTLLALACLNTPPGPVTVPEGTAPAPEQQVSLRDDSIAAVSGPSADIAGRDLATPPVQTGRMPQAEVTTTVVAGHLQNGDTAQPAHVMTAQAPGTTINPAAEAAVSVPNGAVRQQNSEPAEVLQGTSDKTTLPVSNPDDGAVQRLASPVGMKEMYRLPVSDRMSPVSSSTEDSAVGVQNGTPSAETELPLPRGISPKRSTETVSVEAVQTAPVPDTSAVTAVDRGTAETKEQAVTRVMPRAYTPEQVSAVSRQQVNPLPQRRPILADDRSAALSIAAETPAAVPESDEPVVLFGGVSVRRQPSDVPGAGRQVVPASPLQDMRNIRQQSVREQQGQHPQIVSLDAAGSLSVPLTPEAGSEAVQGVEIERNGLETKEAGTPPIQDLYGQVRGEHQKAVSSTQKAAQPEPVRQEVPDQVAQQVKERLSQHELTPGKQQITLTLSPDSLGELKMNLNLQGQKLTVEIVAENRGVRDVIVQHTDALKESLARQNITMESFDVTTGGRGSSQQEQNQNAWRELVKQQHQQQFWASAATYRNMPEEMPAHPAAYQNRQGSSMLDIHY